MAIEFSKYMNRLNGRPSISQSDIDDALKKMDFYPPNDYLEFLMTWNGAEGFVGANYLQLWKAEDLIQLNRTYNVNEYAPGHFIFGSNGGGTAYAFDKKSLKIVTFEFIGMLIADRPEVIANDFLEFLKFLSKS